MVKKRDRGVLLRINEYKFKGLMYDTYVAFVKKIHYMYVYVRMYNVRI